MRLAGAGRATKNANSGCHWSRSTVPAWTHPFPLHHCLFWRKRCDTDFTSGSNEQVNVSPDEQRHNARAGSQPPEHAPSPHGQGEGADGHARLGGEHAVEEELAAVAVLVGGQADLADLQLVQPGDAQVESGLVAVAKRV